MLPFVILGFSVLVGRAGFHDAARAIRNGSEAPFEAFGKAIPIMFFVFVFWAAQLAGWEAPTPENIRKLDAELEGRQ